MDISTGGTTTATFAIGKRIVHRNWWTVLPAIPRSKETRSYHSLRRVWFDHTNNWSRRADDGSMIDVPKFFVEGLEDQLTPALFHTWAGFPDNAWANALLQLLGCAVSGKVRNISWSYQYEEKLPNGKWSAIADIAIHWEDDAGRAVVVVEAKRPGGTLGPKDVNGECYTSMPGFVSAGRRVDYALLLDASDVAGARQRHSGIARILSLQDLVACQIEELSKVRIDKRVADHLISALITWSEHLGIRPSCGTRARANVAASVQGTAERYRQLEAQTEDPKLRELLVGFEVVLAVQKELQPVAPYAWLAQEPDAQSIQVAKRQDNYDRIQPVWNLDWSAQGAPLKR